MNNTVKTLLLGTVGTAGLLFASNASADAATVKVQTNDTVWAFSQKYGVSIKTIETLNKIDTNSHIIRIGQTLNVPSKENVANTNTSSATNNVAHDSSVTVKTGDSLWTIAQANGISVSDLRSANGLSNNETIILPGQKLTFTGSKENVSVSEATTEETVKPVETAKPVETKPETTNPVVTDNASTSKTVTVKAGDSLWTIAQANGMTVSALCDANGLSSDSIINPGQTLNLTGSVAKETTNDTTSSSNTTSNSNQSSNNNSSSTTNNNSNSSSNTNQTASYSASKIISIAKSYIGTPYVWGGSTPAGFDCSGFTQYVFAKAGIQLNRVTTGQEQNVSIKSVSAAQPGDLLFWGAQGASYHVGIYLGGGQYIAAPEPGQNVKIGALAYYPASFAGTVNR